jgi:hypothetical protein
MEQWLDDFQQTVESASSRLMAIDETNSQRPRAEEKWSPKQILGHLIDSAANNHARFVLAQTKDDLVFPGYDQEAWVNLNHYQERPWRQIIELWRAYNLQLHHLMAHATPEKMNTPCTLHTLQEIAFKTVPQAQPVTLEFLMKDYVDHLKHHLSQIFSEPE